MFILDYLRPLLQLLFTLQMPNLEFGTAEPRLNLPGLIKLVWYEFPGRDCLHDPSESGLGQVHLKTDFEHCVTVNIFH